jgi:hypothetical protein
MVRHDCVFLGKAMPTAKASSAILDSTLGESIQLDRQPHHYVKGN